MITIFINNLINLIRHNEIYLIFSLIIKNCFKIGLFDKNLFGFKDFFFFFGLKQNFI